MRGNLKVLDYGKFDGFGKNRFLQSSLVPVRIVFMHIKIWGYFLATACSWTLTTTIVNWIGNSFNSDGEN